MTCSFYSCYAGNIKTIKEYVPKQNISTKARGGKTHEI